MVLSKDLKIAICFGLIMGAILSLCNLCFASEEISFNTIEGLTIQQETGYVINSDVDLGYIEIEPGYLYTFKNDLFSNFRIIGFSNKILEYHDYVEDYFEVAPQESFSFTYSDYKYAYFNTNNTNLVTLTREPLKGMGGFIDELAYSLSVNGVWDTVLACVPLIAICVLFGFGVFNIVRFLRLIIKIRGGM